MSEPRRIQQRTIISTSVLGFFGLIGTILFVRDWGVSLPLVLTYAALVYDTFFSIRYFFSITPTKDLRQTGFDFALMVCYGVIAWNLAHPLGFMYSMAIMFAIASMKYIVLRKQIGASEILARKIRIDVVGVIAYSAVTIPLVFGWVWQASWVLLLLYVIANIQILWRNPLYPYQKPQIS